MEINEYQKAALRTANSEMSDDLILNGILGLCGETGEVSDHIKKYMFQGHELDTDKLVNELGDVCWYIAILASGLNVDLETVMKKNIEKLQRRYPDGFDTSRSLHRPQGED
jgi:NTP pyrophosphatase (non-canonical NTP hydrolase)